MSNSTKMSASKKYPQREALPGDATTHTTEKVSQWWLRGGMISKRRSLARTRWYQRITDTYICGWLWLLWTSFKNLLVNDLNLNVIERSRLIEDVIERPKNYRHLFLNDDVDLRVNISGASHSHPRPAAFRSAANAYMNRIVTAHGFDTYNVSMSATDNGRGTRYFYGEKDLGIPFQNDPVQDNDALVFCDVDYYADMNSWLKYFRPIMMYTFVPTQTAYRDDHIAYKMERNNVVTYRILGGSSYQHQLWDYTGDTVSVVDDDSNLCVFNIEQRNIPGDSQHRLIVLTPMARIPFPECKLMFVCNPLQRKRFTQGTTCQLYDSITDSLSISEVGTWHAVTIKGKQYAALQQRMKNKKSPPLVSDVERLLSASGDSDAPCNAPLLFNHLGLKIRHNFVSTGGAISYLPVGPLATEDGKVTVQQVTTPLMTEPALAPEKAYNTDAATVKGRITSVQNDKVPHRVYLDLSKRFIDAVIGKAGCGVPLTVSEVNAAQSKVQQRARFQLVKDTLTRGVKNTLQCFVKVEAYGSVNDPRNITTMAAQITILLSAFTLAFKKNCLKGKHDWYGPGKKPKQSLEYMQMMASKASSWLVVDYSRLDGTISKWMQSHLSNAMYLRWVSPAHRAELNSLLRQVFKQNARTMHGINFKPGFGTRSGSPQTTDGNTVMCAFVSYAAHCRLGLSHDEAMANIGLIYGDDGLIVSRVGLKEAMEGVARDLGLKLKCDEVSVDEPVSYLGRYFVHLPTTTASFQDPLRTMSKMHLSTQKNVSFAQAAANKAHGYRATDINTPVIGNWCKRVIAITGLSTKSLTGELQYRMSNAWPPSDKEKLFAPMAKILGVAESELRFMDKEMEKVQSLDQIPILFDNVREVKIPAIVDGLIVEPRARSTLTPRQDAIAVSNSNLQLSNMDGENSTCPEETSAGHDNSDGAETRPSGQGGLNPAAAEFVPCSAPLGTVDGRTVDVPEQPRSNPRSDRNRRRRQRKAELRREARSHVGTAEPNGDGSLAAPETGELTGNTESAGESS